MDTDIETLKKDLKEAQEDIQFLLGFVESLQSDSTIPTDIDQAFRSRFSTTPFAVTTTKTLASETQAVSESGSSSYNVPKLMDGYVQRTLESGVTVYLPYYI